MDRQAALTAYAQAILPEREAFLYRRALSKVRPITRGMKPEEAEAYLKSRAFESALYRVKRGDRAYQALQRGELVLEEHQAEFERLAPMILGELRRGAAIDLAFLRSVERSRVPLKKARAALRRLDGQAPRRFLDGQAKRLAAEADGRVERWLRRGDFSHAVAGDPRVEEVVAFVLDSTFKKGIGAGIVDRAWQPGSVMGTLRGELRRAFPELPVYPVSGATGPVPPGMRAMNATDREIRHQLSVRRNRFRSSNWRIAS